MLTRKENKRRTYFRERLIQFKSGDKVPLTMALSKSQLAAFVALGKNGCVRLQASSDHLMVYEHLVSIGWAYAEAFDESARFYAFTKLGNEMWQKSQEKSA